MIADTRRLLTHIELLTEHTEEALDYYSWLLAMPQLRSSPAYAGLTRRIPQGTHPGWVPCFRVRSMPQALSSVRKFGGQLKSFTTGRTRHYALASSGYWVGITEHPQVFPVDATHPRMRVNIDCVTPEVESTSQFLQALIGLTSLHPHADPHETRLLIADGQVATGVLRMHKVVSAHTHPSWVIYFWVPDLVATAVRATESGARVLVPPTPSPFDLYTILQDPWGHLFGLTAPLPDDTSRLVPVRDATGNTGPLENFIDPVHGFSHHVL